MKTQTFWNSFRYVTTGCWALVLVGCGLSSSLSQNQSIAVMQEESIFWISKSKNLVLEISEDANVVTQIASIGAAYRLSEGRPVRGSESLQRFVLGTGQRKQNGWTILAPRCSNRLDDGSTVRESAAEFAPNIPIFGPHSMPLSCFRRGVVQRMQRYERGGDQHPLFKIKMWFADGREESPPDLDVELEAVSKTQVLDFYLARER